jgi:hypothetical protein
MELLETWLATPVVIEIVAVKERPFEHHGPKPAVVELGQEAHHRREDSPGLGDVTHHLPPSWLAGPPVPGLEAAVPQQAVSSRWGPMGRIFGPYHRLLAGEGPVSSHHARAWHPLLGRSFPIQICPSPSAARSNF